MKTWLIPLPFLFVAGLASAADPVPTSATPKADEAATPAAAPKPTATVKTRRHPIRHLPRGDLRYCLDLKDHKAIIACAERQGKK